MFIKRGTPEQILKILNEENLTDEQKEAVKKVADEVVKSTDQPKKLVS
jgi:hypothetical protein